MHLNISEPWYNILKHCKTWINVSTACKNTLTRTSYECKNGSDFLMSVSTFFAPSWWDILDYKCLKQTFQQKYQSKSSRCLGNSVEMSITFMRFFVLPVFAFFTIWFNVPKQIQTLHVTFSFFRWFCFYNSDNCQWLDLKLAGNWFFVVQHWYCINMKNHWQDLFFSYTIKNVKLLKHACFLHQNINKSPCQHFTGYEGRTLKLHDKNLDPSLALLWHQT